MGDLRRKLSYREWVLRDRECLIPVCSQQRGKRVLDIKEFAGQVVAAMSSTLAVTLAFLIGLFGGLRALTPPAVTAWAARLGWLKLSSPLTWLGSLPAVILFTLLALAELVSDKLPKTPRRTAPPGLIARVVLGGLCGGAVYLAAAHQGLLIGVLVGAVGGIVGCFGGYQIRIRLVKALGSPDYVVAVVEDLVAIGGSLWVVSRF